jgi:glycosyltransferase involved in cell wall biosynthesis
MRLSVVIASKDRARYIERALASLANQIGAPSFEVIVVDNNSTDDTKAVVEAAHAHSPFPVTYLFEPEPNRGKARNRGIAIAAGYIVLFIDDDIQAPPGLLAAHDAAHGTSNLVVNGPILNVSGYDDRPKPTFANMSRAFLCTCNVSIPRHALTAVGGFDEEFKLYGWEDTELGVRLREHGSRWAFAWDAYIWHIKPPTENTLEVETQKALEKAKMAARFLKKQPTQRARMATGAYGMNLFRARYFLPDRLLAVYAGLASSEKAPPFVRAVARAQFLDGMYTRELSRELRGGDDHA